MRARLTAVRAVREDRGMKKTFGWILLVGSVLVILGVLWQAFTIAAYIRSGNGDWLDAHGAGSSIVHLGQLAIVIAAIVTFWGNARAIVAAIGFLVLSVVQLLALGDTDTTGEWWNGFHGFLALVVLLAAVAYLERASDYLGIKPSGAAGSA
jgi:hypothetical protein